MYECKRNIIHEQDKGASIFNRFLMLSGVIQKLKTFKKSTLSVLI